MAYTFRHGDRPLEGVTIQRAVGRGGFGEVYYALTDSGKQIAVKYLRDNPEVELRGIAHVINLKSPHLITIYDVKQGAEGEPFVLMEYVSGPSLRDLLTAEPKGLGAQKASYILCGIAQGLAYLHERGIVHRDLKPANIFYDDGYVKIGDYGLSKHISVSQHSGQTVSVGTVHYMAPEIGSGSYSKAIDIYALGVILFEMLTGRLPFTGGSMGEILMRHLSERPDLSGIGEPFAGIIRKALAKDPKERFQDASEMVAAIRGSTDLSASIATFDASVFAGVPRQSASDDATRTGATPPRPLPAALDARDAGRAERLEARLDLKTAEIQRKLERVEHKLAGKRGRREWNGGKGGDRPAAPGDAAASMQGKSRLLHAFVLIAATVAASLLIGVLSGRRETEERVAFLAFGLMGVTAGALFAHLVCLPRIMMRSTFLDRITYGSVGALFMAPFLIGAFDETPEFARVLFTPIAMLVLCDFHKRIEAGRRGFVSGTDAIVPAIVGVVAAGIARADGGVPWAGVICGLTSLLIQSAAAMWPVGSFASNPRPSGTPAARTRPQLEAEPPGGTETAGAAAAVGRAAPDITDSAMRTAADAIGKSAVEMRREDRSPTVSRRAVIDPDAPSFVGRATNAGLSLFGKLLLLIGMTAAVAYSTLNISVDGGRDAIRMQGGELIVTEYHISREPIGIPRVVPLVPIVIGSLALLVARRHDGGWHFARGFAGCVLTGVACIIALAPATEGLRVLFSNSDWRMLRNAGGYGPLFAFLTTVAISGALLFWPKGRRGQQAIVV